MGGGSSREITVRSFSGDEDVDDFFAEVEVAILMFSLRDYEAAASVAKALVGRASLWFDNQKKEFPEITASWVKLKVKDTLI